MSEKHYSQSRPLITATLWACVALALLLLGCEVERRKSDAELGLNPQQIAGRHVYDEYCDRCHAPYSSGGRQGPGLKGVFKQQYLPRAACPRTMTAWAKSSALAETRWKASARC